METPTATHSDLAYGNQYAQIGKRWYVKFSFRAPGGAADWLKADQYMVMAIGRMVQAGKIVPRSNS